VSAPRTSSEPPVEGAPAAHAVGESAAGEDAVGEDPVGGSSADVSLTDEQLLVVARRDEPLIVSAGAGSGKTSVLVERFVAAVVEDGVSPGRILAITFTDRAAGELRDRVRARFLALGRRELARDTEMAFVSTFHGFCTRVLREHALLAGLDPDFKILDEGLAARLRERAFRMALADFQSGGGDAAVDLVAAYGSDQLSAMILGVHAELRSRGERAPRLPPVRLREDRAEDRDERDAAAACTLLDELLAAFGRRYEQLKHARAALDFDDLELEAGALLCAQERVRAAFAQRFELVMVDEFQDTNPRQLAILRALERGNLFTVGDELQAIYGFRHADVALFRSRRDELARRGASLQLTGNFRSRAELLAVINGAFAERMGERHTPLRARREQRCAGGPEPLVELLLTSRAGWEGHAADGHAGALGPATAWRHAEARLLAARVAELVREGAARAGEIVVLLRALGDIEVYERALQLEGLRTLAVVGAFWDRLQIRDLLAYLRVLANPLDDSALYETLATPMFAVSNDALGLVAEAARLEGGAAWEAAHRFACGPSPAPEGDEPGHLPLERLARGDRAALLRFCAWLEREHRAVALHSISQLLVRAMLAFGYRESVLALGWGERRLANVNKLLRLARLYEAGQGRDLRGFIDHVQTLDALGLPERDAPVEGVEPDAVRLMTIHAAKGLEFDVVCVADLGRAPNKRQSRLLVDPPRIGLSLVRLDGAKALPCLDYDELAGERLQAQAEEEDRVLYVAMTRARERLLLSGALDFERWPSPPATTMMDWLAPLLAGALSAPLAQAPAVCDIVIEGEQPARVRCHLNAPTPVRDGGAESASLPGGVPVEPPAAGTGSSASGGTGGPVEPPAADPGRSASGSRRPQPLSERALAGESISYTSLSELERCGYRYYLERVLGLPEDPAAVAGDRTERLAPRARGVLVHRLLETLDFGGGTSPSPEEVAACARGLGLRAGGQELVELAELIARARGAGLAVRIAAAEQVLREHPFAFVLASGGPLITGVLDVLAREGSGGLLVVDYKSDRVRTDAVLEDVVEQEYALQRAIYALAVLRDGASSVEVVHWFLERPQQPIHARFGEGDRAALEERLAARLRDAERRGFSVSPLPHRRLCSGCPGRASLCSWDEEHTLREQPERVQSAPAPRPPPA